MLLQAIDFHLEDQDLDCLSSLAFPISKHKIKTIQYTSSMYTCSVTRSDGRVCTCSVGAGAAAGGGRGQGLSLRVSVTQTGRLVQQPPHWPSKSESTVAANLKYQKILLDLSRSGHGGGSARSILTLALASVAYGPDPPADSDSDSGVGDDDLSQNDWQSTMHQNPVSNMMNCTKMVI